MSGKLPENYEFYIEGHIIIKEENCVHGFKVIVSNTIKENELFFVYLELRRGK